MMLKLLIPVYFAKVFRLPGRIEDERRVLMKNITIYTVFLFLFIGCNMQMPGFGDKSISSISDIADLSREEFSKLDTDAQKEIQKKFDKALKTGDKKIGDYMSKSPGSSPFNYNLKTNSLLNSLPMKCEDGEFGDIRKEIEAKERKKLGFNKYSLQYEQMRSDLEDYNNHLDKLKNLEDWYIEKTKSAGGILAKQKYELNRHLAEKEKIKADTSTFGEVANARIAAKITELKAVSAKTKNDIDQKTEEFKKKLKSSFKKISNVNFDDLKGKSIKDVASFVQDDLKKSLEDTRSEKETKLKEAMMNLRALEAKIKLESDKVEKMPICEDHKKEKKEGIIAQNLLMGKKQLKCNAENKDTTEQNATDDQNHYNQIVADLENNAHLTKILMRLASNQEIKNHQKALESIPVGIARESFVNAAGMDNSKLIVPPGSKEILKKIKEKYQALQEVKERLEGLKLLHDKGDGKGSWTNYINPFRAWDKYDDSFALRKKEAIEAIKEYDEISLKKEVDQLKKNKFSFKSADSEDLLVSGKLDNTKNYIEALTKIEKPESVANGADFIKSSENYAKKLDKRIKDLEDKQMKDMEQMVAQMFCSSGNKAAYAAGASKEGRRCQDDNIVASGDVINFLKGADDEGYDTKEKGKLSDRLEEVTGFTFDPDMTFDFIKSTTADFDDRNMFKKYSTELLNDSKDLVGLKMNKHLGARYSQYKNMFENMKSNYSNQLGPKVKEAMAFFDDYDELYKHNMDKNGFDENFTNPIDDLSDKLKIGDEFQGGHGHGVFSNWMKGVCSGQGASDCNMKNIFLSAERLGKGGEVLDQLTSMLGLSLSDKRFRDEDGNLKMGKDFMDVLKKRLKGIEEARKLLIDQSDKCEDDNPNSTKYTDVDDINNRGRNRKKEVENFTKDGDASTKVEK